MRILIALLALMPLSAHAACQAGSEPVQSCSLSGGNKVLDVCLMQDSMSYSFGKAGEDPDLRLSAPITQAGYVPWNGVGRSIYEEVSFYNQGVTYLVWYAVDRTIDAHPISGGIVVRQGDKQLATMSCDENSVITGFDAVYDRMTTLGHCWAYETHEWVDCN